MNNTPPIYYFTWSPQAGYTSIEVEHAEGACFFLKSGEILYDMLSASFQAGFGHSHPVILDKMRNQLHGLMVAFPKAEFDLKTKVTDRLVKYVGLDGGKIFYTVSGAEGIENAAKMARQIRGTDIILARTNSFHGASLGALSITGDWRNKAHHTVDEWTVRIPEPDVVDALDRTREIILHTGPEKIAAICLESISGANGVLTGNMEWWKGIQALCDEFGFFLIMDEVLCGFQRTGRPFAFQGFPVRPNFVVMGKAISAGYFPFGAVWTDRKVADYYQDRTLACGLTNYAHPLGLAAMDGVLDVLADPDFSQSVRDLEKLFKVEMLALAKEPEFKAMRCHGLLAAADFSQPSKLNWQDFVAAGVFVFCNEQRLVLAPPMIMSGEQLKICFTKIRQVLVAKGTT
jgi:taurine---2-oxoglutarate transaminase